jgi:DNA-binding HxlR family transcriptional regulator
MSDVHRFSELKDAIPGLSDRMLSARLDELQTEGLVERRVTPRTPVLVEYHLTEKGMALIDVIQAISDWAVEWSDDSAHAADHRSLAARGTTAG